MTTAYTFSNPVPLDAAPAENGIIQQFVVGTTNPSEATFAPDGYPAAPIFGFGGQALQGNELIANSVATLVSYIGPLLNSGALCWILFDCPGGAQQITDTTKSPLAMTLAQAQSLFSDAPGDIKYTAGNNTTTGWLKANGALVSRATYEILFNEIGTRYGAGDGTTTFALPDLRGEFIRGVDDGRGIDPNRLLGSNQADALNPATLKVNTGWSTSGWQADSCAQNPSQMYGATSGHNINCGVKEGVIFGGGSETRPTNIALLALIKY